MQKLFELEVIHPFFFFLKKKPKKLNHEKFNDVIA